jgi:hypothetical protein
MAIETILKKHAEDIILKDIQPKKKRLSEIAGRVKERFTLFGKILGNHTHYTVCMDGKEEAVHIFRVCNDRLKGISCYDQMNLDIELKIIDYKGKAYLICPKAVQMWDEKDYEKYKAK